MDPILSREVLQAALLKNPGVVTEMLRESLQRFPISPEILRAAFERQGGEVGALCASMGIDPSALDRSALQGHWTVYESSPGNNADGQTIFTLDSSGGFMLQSIICSGVEGSQAANVGIPCGTFQIEDMARNRKLFSRAVQSAMFTHRSASPTVFDSQKLSAAGAQVGRLPQPYYFRPNSSFVVSHNPDPEYVASGTIYLLGYRFRGGNGPQLPDPKREFYGHSIVTTNSRGSVLVDSSELYQLDQIVTCVSDTPGPTGQLFGSRFNLKDSRLSRDLFDDPVPMQLFQTGVGPEWKMHEAYTFTPQSTIQLTLDSGNTDGQQYGFYLLGSRRYA